jgi:arylsulfatase A-like enzyme
MQARVLSALALGLLAGSLRAAERPNVLVLVSDDQQHDTIAALGHPIVKTPNLDKLVRNGFAFTHAFCMGSTVPAVCAPSRAMFLTGRSLYRVAVQVPKDVPLWPEVMGQAGYATCGVGKWHNGPAAYARAFQNGGPIFFGGMSDQKRVPVHDYDPAGKYPKKDEHVGDRFSSELFADGAIRFLKGHKGDKPFFLYVAFTAPHDPRTPPKQYLDLYDPEKIPLPKNFLPVHPFNNGEMTVRDEKLLPWPRKPAEVKKEIAAYYGMISHMDAQIGRILKELEDSGRLKNTLVVFWSDHGLALGHHGLLGKQNLYDHSMRAPLVFFGPGVPKGKSDALCYLFDIFPTVAELTGTKLPEGVEGKSLAGVMAGKERKVRDSLFCAYRDVQRAVRTERWKLIRYPQINKSQLFDLQEDPDERKDLADDPKHAERLKEMMALLEKWQKDVGDKQPLSTDKPAPLHIELPPKDPKK